MDITRLFRTKNKIIAMLSFLFILSLSFSQQSNTDLVNDNKYENSINRYVTDQDGNILMYVNVWGHVKNPGNHLVYDGIDLITLLSVVGGPLSGAKLNKVLIYRDSKDANGQIKYEVNLNKFYSSGDRSELIRIMPNDTIIIKENLFSSIFRNSNMLTTILQMLNIYIQIENNNQNSNPS